MSVCVASGIARSVACAQKKRRAKQRGVAPWRNGVSSKACWRRSSIIERRAWRHISGANNSIIGMARVSCGVSAWHNQHNQTWRQA